MPGLIAPLLIALQVAATGPIVPPPGRDLPRAAINDNRTPAGTLRDGVLTVRLVATWSSWTLKNSAQNLPMLAFAEEGRAPSIPGPVLRAPVGTRVRVSIRNPLADARLVVRGLTSHGSNVTDSLVVGPNQTIEHEFVADAEGTFYYWGSVTGATPQRRFGYDSQLNGALVVDGPSASRNDRIFLITLYSDSTRPNGAFRIDREFWAINGKSWPETERLEYTEGDSVSWRIINASADNHPMHLHGFYYRVDALGDNRRDTVYTADQKRMVVTERMRPGTTMAMTWSPDRPGGWIFHCHMTVHLLPHAPLAGQPVVESSHDPAHHTETGMAGLMLAMNVRPRPGTAPPPATTRRELRLFVQSDSVSGDSARQFAFVLQEGQNEPSADSLLVPGSRLVLHRDEPTTITVINRTPEPASIHWHGIELDSYFDGVVGIGSMSGSVTPPIMPADSFKVHITAPRAGSFMYHTHFDDVRQQTRGLYAPLTVLEPREQLDAARDISMMISNDWQFAVLVNGSRAPAEVQMQAGTTYRLRIANITVSNPALIVSLSGEAAPGAWRAIAKDGFALPSRHATMRAARQPVSNGEIFDFEVTPTRAGAMVFEVRGGTGNLLTSQPIRVLR